MKTSEVVRAWGKILKGERPSLSIEITRECPLQCPGCYAYEDAHLGGGATLRSLSDRKGKELVDGVLELESMMPQLLGRGIHVQVVTSAFRPLAAGWSNLPHLNIVVSIDGLQPEHDVRRAPATYDRIIRNIANQNVTIHCTVTGQMMKRPGYLKEFLEFWSPRPEIRKIWFSLFTPQIGDRLPEMLRPEERERAIVDMTALRRQFPKLDMPEGLIRQFSTPPSTPQECVFALTTQTLSADLRTKVVPCQFGGNPDCHSCGCIASMGLAAVAAHKLGGFIPVGAIFKASIKIGRIRARASAPPPTAEEQLRIVS